MLGMPGGIEWIIIGSVILLLFGGSKLPKLGGAIGESIKNFKKGVRDTDPKSLEDPKKKENIDPPPEGDHKP